jgi:hypothetical protein
MPENERMVEELQAQLATLQQTVSTLMLRFGEQEQELSTLHDIVMDLTERRQPGPAPAKAAASAGLPGSDTPVVITPALREVLRLIHSGDVAAAKQSLAGIPAEERNAYPAVLAIVAAAMCVASDDYTRAASALDKARQLTGDPRLLRIAELVEQRLPKG